MGKPNMIVVKTTKPTNEMTDEELEEEFLQALSAMEGRKVERSTE